MDITQTSYNQDQAAARKFTIIEFLVVLVIIGLLGTLAAVALGSARSKSRDARRLFEIKQTQFALESFYVEQNAYPVVPVPGIVLGTGNQKALCSNGGFKTVCVSGDTPYAPTLSIPPKPADGKCTDNQNQYVYQSDGESYKINFCLGGPAGKLPAGPRVADQNGIK